MQLDGTIRSKTALDCISEIGNRLKNMNPAKVSRENIACPLPLVTSHVEHERATIQFIFQPEGFVAVDLPPPLKGQIPGGRLRDGRRGNPISEFYDFMPNAEKNRGRRGGKAGTHLRPASKPESETAVRLREAGDVVSACHLSRRQMQHNHERGPMLRRRSSPPTGLRNTCPDRI